MSLFALKHRRTKAFGFAKAMVSVLFMIAVLAPTAAPLTVYGQPFDSAAQAAASYKEGPADGTGNKISIGKTLLDNCGISAFSDCFAAIIYFLFVGVTSLLAAVAGYFFDFTTAIALTANTYSNTFINQAWTIARDLANMVFVFLLIFLAFTLILDIAHAGVGKQLAKIIAVALLINFSFFFTRVVIDASNIISHAFYDAIAGRTIETGGASITAGTQELRVKSLSENIMNGINAQRLFDDTSGSGFKQFYEELRKKDGVANFFLLATVFIMMGGMNIILIFIFLAVGIQMIGRIVRLWLVIMLSPIGFITWIIPGLGSLSKKWWDTLLHAAFFAPAFMLCIYITIRLVAGNCSGGTCTGGLLSGLSFGTVAGTQYVEQALMVVLFVVIRLAIVAALLFASLKVGDYFGQTSARAVMTNVQKYGGMAGRYSGFGTASSYLIGGGARRLDKAMAGTRFGNNNWFGYKFRQYAVQPVAKNKFFGTESAADRFKRVKEEKKERQGNVRDISNKEMLTAAAFQEDLKTPHTKESFDLLDEETKAKAKAILQNATPRELEAIGPKLLANLSHLQSEAVVKKIDGIDAFTEAERAANREAWATRRATNGQLGATDAPVNKIDERIVTIRNQAQNLSAQYRYVAGAVSADTIISKTSIEGATKDIDKEIGKLKAERENYLPAQGDSQAQITAKAAERARIDTDIRGLTAIAKKYEEIDEERKKIATPGGTFARADGTGAEAMAAAGQRATRAGEIYAPPGTPPNVPPVGGGNNPPNNPPPPGGPRLQPFRRPTPSGRSGLGMGAKSGAVDTRANRPLTIDEMVEAHNRKRAGESDDTPPEDGGDDTTPPSSTPPRGGGGGPRPGDTGAQGTITIAGGGLTGAAPVRTDYAQPVSDTGEPGEVLRSFNTPLREGVGVNEPEKAILKDDYEKMRQGLSNPEILTPFDLLPPDQVSKFKQTKDKYERFGTSLGEAVKKNPELADKLGRHQEKIRSYQSQIRELDRNRSELEAAGQNLPELEKQRKTLEDGQAREAEAYTRTLEEGLRPFAPKSEVVPPAREPQSPVPSASVRTSASQTPLASSTIPQVSGPNAARQTPPVTTNKEQASAPRVTRVENERSRIEANRQAEIHEVGSRISSASQQGSSVTNKQSVPPAAPAHPNVVRERARAAANTPAPVPAQPRPVVQPRSADSFLPPTPQARVTSTERLSELRHSVANDNRHVPLAPEVQARAERKADRAIIDERINSASMQPPVPPAANTNTPPPPPKNEDLAA